MMTSLSSSEYQEQCALFKWAERMRPTYPDLEMLFATLNGVRLPIGLAVKAKKQGNMRGVPDVFLDVARGGYHGLRIEMKVGKNKQTKEQVEWAKNYARNGYKVAVCYSWECATDVIEHYLKGEEWNY